LGRFNGDVIGLTRRRSLAPCKTSAVADVSVDMMEVVVCVREGIEWIVC
jgi:hypothetical protein